MHIPSFQKEVSWIAKGFGRSLDLTTLMVLIRDRVQEEGLESYYLKFDVNKGFTAWLGTREPDDAKFYETWDSALLALLIGQEKVPGTEDY